MTPGNQTAKVNRNVFALKRSQYEGLNTGLENMKTKLKLKKYKNEPSISKSKGRTATYEEELN